MNRDSARIVANRRASMRAKPLAIGAVSVPHLESRRVMAARIEECVDEESQRQR